MSDNENVSSQTNSKFVFRNITIPLPKKRRNRKQTEPKKHRVRHGFFITSNDQRDKHLIREYIDSQTVNNLPNKTPYTLPASTKSINFNKTNMSEHIDIEIDTTTVYKSMHHMMKSLTTQEACRKHLEKLRWNGEPICPKCGSQRKDHYQILTRGINQGRLKCKDCKLPFSVTVGTIFEKSTIPLDKWFMALFMFNDGKKGISSLQLHRQIGVTQKTAWFMLNRIRNSVANRIDFEFDGITQVDETFVGGKNKNRSKGKKVANTQGRSVKTKTPVFGMLNQDGFVYTEVIQNTKAKTLKPIIRAKVKAGSVVVSDSWMGYRGLWWDYSHVIIKHNQDIFKYGPYHTNGIEGFWSLLKRGIIGMYHFVSPKHLHRYCDEFTYRYNTRRMGQGEKFNLILVNSDISLMYKDLISA